MGIFRKRSDPIKQRSRALQAQIAALDAQIKQLNSQAQKEQSQPHVRSTVLPHRPQGQTPPTSPANTTPAASLAEPVFEPVDHHGMTALSDAETTASHYNDLGVRKYDLAAAWRRIRNHLAGPATPNSKLVNYLAAGTIRGLRPLRYEKRVARNRFVFFSILLLLVIWGVLAMFMKQR